MTIAEIRQDSNLVPVARANGDGRTHYVFTA